MRYIAFTQPTATWLLARTEVLNAICELVIQPHLFEKLMGGEAAEGPLRVAVSADGKLAAIWNTDYLTGTGDELWGFIKVDLPLGLLEQPEISREVLERCLYI